jgi:hypothetical protein
MLFQHTVIVYGIVCGAVLALVGPKVRADLLEPGSRSGSVSVAVSGENSGIGAPSPISETFNIPGTGAGNTASSAWSNGFADAFGSPPQNTTAGMASSTINLNQVSGDTYSLSAASTFGFVNTGSSGDPSSVLPTRLTSRSSSHNRSSSPS